MRLTLNRLSSLFLLLALAFAFFNSARLLFFPMLQGEAYGFRDDNFWSLTSGFYRRFLPGDFLYYTDLVTSFGIEIYSLVLITLFGFFAILVYRELNITLQPIEKIILSLSPIVLLYQVDSEIFLLLPILPLLFIKDRSAREATFLLLLLFSIFVRELSILFYAPVLLWIIVQSPIKLKIAATSIVAIFVFSILFLSGEPTYGLERDYWPAQGVSDLETTHLYQFAEKSITEVLALHLSLIQEYFIIFAPGVVLFLLLCCTYIYRRTSTAYPVVFFIVLCLVSFVLTIDYGRYYYLFFFLCVFLSSDNVRGYYQLPRGLDALFGRIFEYVNASFQNLSRVSKYFFAATAAAFVLAPVGYYIEYYDPWPRVVMVTIKMFELTGLA